MAEARRERKIALGRELRSALGCDSGWGSSSGTVSYAGAFTPRYLTGVIQLLVIPAIS